MNLSYRPCKLFSIAVVFGFLGSPAWIPAHAEDCRVSTSEWLSMQKREITITKSDGSTVRTPAKIADDAHERSAGFQHICPSTVNKMPILFLFPRPTTAWFHMTNVHAPLDIAFVAENGRIVEIQQMAVYPSGGAGGKKKLYRSSVPVVAALEAHAGFFSSLGVSVDGARLELTD